MSKTRNTRNKKITEKSEDEVKIDLELKKQANNKQKEDLKLDEKSKDKNEEVIEKRTLRPKRSYSSLTKAASAAPESIPKPVQARKRKTSGEKSDTKPTEEKVNEEIIQEEIKETSGRRGNKHKIPVLFEDSPDEDQENEPQKKVKAAPKTRVRKASDNKIKKSDSNSNLGNNLSVSATATAIVNSGISCTSSLVDENKPVPKSIMKSKENKMEQDAEEKKTKRGVRIQDNIAEKSEILGVKCDKHKYSASTSTPSGLRRKPLKLPQDVSMICKSEIEVNTTS